MAALDVIQAKYVATAVKKSQYPTDGLAEVAFLGRSNVGKSSLINSLCNHRGLARVSGSPGKTQTINYYGVTLRHEDGEDVRRYPLYFVDLPGYGFAKTGKKQRDMWSAFIHEYIRESTQLRLLCLLIDSRHPGLDLDLQAYEWLLSAGVSVQIVATKSDKLRARERQQNLRTLAELFPDGGRPLLYSSLKRQGQTLLLQQIIHTIA